MHPVIPRSVYILFNLDRHLDIVNPKLKFQHNVLSGVISPKHQSYQSATIGILFRGYFLIDNNTQLMSIIKTAAQYLQGAYQHDDSQSKDS
jgi:hypothetical protein